MSKIELIKKVADKTNLNQTQVNEVINALQDAIVEGVMDEDCVVSLPKLGTFRKKVNAPRKGINPLNQKPMDVPESHTIFFRPMPSIKRVMETTKKKVAKK